MTTPFPFVAGQVLTAAQLNDIQNLPITDKTASYTLIAGDVTKRTIMNNASATTITVNNSIFTVGDVIQVANKGAGTCTITAGAGVTINTSGNLGLAQYGGGYLLALSASTFTFFNLGGGSPTVPSAVSYLVVAGGGGGGNTDASVFIGGGGGAGGLRSTVTATGGGGTLETAFAATSGVTYTITIGAGGASNTAGVDSSVAGTGLTTITSVGGGRGAGTNAASIGGSGGGGNQNGATGAAGTANQGRAGGSYSAGPPATGPGGGGGADVAGANGTATNNGGAGGAGVAVAITGSSVTYGGGGGGAGTTAGAGGAGGGGAGSTAGIANAGTANLGGGGGGSRNTTATAGAAGGKGVVILRTPNTNIAASITGGTFTSNATHYIYTFNDSGTIKWGN
jgi:hypothetical protein